MTGRREELVRAEGERWAEVAGLLSQLTPDQMVEPGLIPEGWSVKDLLAHLGCWAAEAARAMERIRLGTYEREDIDVDARNRELYEACRDLDLGAARAECAAARNRMLQEWFALAEITSEAEDWFSESGPRHYEEHLPDLRRWVTELTSGRGPAGADGEIHGGTKGRP